MVLAGGRSRRFGGVDKARLPLGGQTLLARAVDTLSQVCGGCVVVGAPAVRGAGALPDLEPGTGPLGGILTALEALTTPYALVLATDLPFISVDLLARLQDAASSADVAWLAADRRRPLCVAVARRLAPELRGLWTAGARRVRDLDAIGSAVIVEVAAAATHSALWNVNDPLTYARALEMAEHDCPAC